MEIPCLVDPGRYPLAPTYKDGDEALDLVDPRATAVPYTLNVSLLFQRPVTVSSPTHDICLTLEAEPDAKAAPGETETMGRQVVSLQPESTLGSTGTVALIIEPKTNPGEGAQEPAQPPAAWLAQNTVDTASPGSAGIFFQIPVPSSTELPPPPRKTESLEAIFILDRSGSMSGSNMKKARETLQLFLRSLPSENTYFNVVGFGSTFQVRAYRSDENLE